ncbi:hypothetical protein E2C01_006209 [Portunus trituberculatus]|uniref:Transmembrane protein n=1 Tax=Portunus trituberculatus TaxID=210409 RepID=A0A5B7D160_PORTR|nr:hypothetical protein [Portunus trituberculatus]
MQIPSLHPTPGGVQCLHPLGSDWKLSHSEPLREDKLLVALLGPSDFRPLSSLSIKQYSLSVLSFSSTRGSRTLLLFRLLLLPLLTLMLLSSPTLFILERRGALVGISLGMACSCPSCGSLRTLKRAGLLLLMKSVLSVVNSVLRSSLDTILRKASSSDASGKTSWPAALSESSRKASLRMSLLMEVRTLANPLSPLVFALAVVASLYAAPVWWWCGGGGGAGDAPRWWCERPVVPQGDR